MYKLSVRQAWYDEESLYFCTLEQVKRHITADPRLKYEMCSLEYTEEINIWELMNVKTSNNTFR